MNPLRGINDSRTVAVLDQNGLNQIFPNIPPNTQVRIVGPIPIDPYGAYGSAFDAQLELGRTNPAIPSEFDEIEADILIDIPSEAEEEFAGHESFDSSR